jgi:hypothetical protein
MARHKITLDQLYREGRIHPHGRNADEGAHAPVHHHPPMQAPDQSAPQSEAKAPGYENDVPNNWLRGMPSAEQKPGFDHSQARLRRK